MSKHAGRVVIYKPENNDCTKLKVCCSISLPSCIVIDVEKVDAELLVEEDERRGQLSDGHYGSRKRQSAIDKAAIMVNIAHAAWRRGYRDGVLMIENKVAFPSVARGRLTHNI